MKNHKKWKWKLFWFGVKKWLEEAKKETPKVKNYILTL